MNPGLRLGEWNIFVNYTPPMTKATRLKTPQSVEKGIHADKMKKISYLIEGKDTKEFTAPEETHWNRMLGHNRPFEHVDGTGKFDLSGNLGPVRRFFIAKGELKRLNQIFEQFHLPDSLRPELTWCYVNMVFASTDAARGEQFRARLHNSINKLNETLDLLALLSEGAIKINTLSINYSEATGGVVNRPVKSRTHKMIGPLDTGFLEDMLKLYQQVDAYDVLHKFHTVEKQKAPGKLGRNMGHKNALKQSQSYYANIVFDFLLKNVFQSLRPFTDDPPRLKEETDKLKKIYSDRQLIHFIGILMLEAGLLPPSEDQDEAALIDLMKKKLAGPLAARAETWRQITGKNRRKK
jgi:hypothetical protein